MGLTYPVEQRKWSMAAILPRMRLAKVPLCSMVAFSTTFGFVMASQRLSSQMVFCSLGVFILATGAASCNSLQERKSDAGMKRTENRPLVKGLVSPFQAALQGFLLILSGFLILFLFFESPAPAILGLFSVVVYNCIYTRLKSKTVHALLPGALCGALPPYIGWIAAGGDGFSYSALLLFILFVLWQIPHFFLVLLNHKRDYVNSVTPNMLKLLKESGLRRLFITWIGGLSASMLAFTVIPYGLSDLQRVLICVNALFLFLLFGVQLIFSKSPNYRFLFIHLNSSIFLIMLIVFVGILRQS